MPRKSVPTIQDVAREAGVSQSTVSSVLNHRFNQTSPETRDRILEVARRLDYHPNAMAAALRRRSTRTIGVVITNILNPFYTAVVRGVQDEARRAGYTTILGNTDDDPEQERQILLAFRAKQVDGMVVVTTGSRNDTIQQVSASGVPVVLVDTVDPSLKLDTIRVDNEAASVNAVNYLLDLGHTRIAIVSGLTTGVPSRAGRLTGFLKAQSARGIEVPKGYRQILSTSVENGRLAANRLIDLPHPPTAVVVANTFLAIGALQAFHQRGLRIPQDISFLMFDDPDWTTLYEVGITTVSQPVHDIGVRAFQLIEARIKRKAAAAPPQEVIFPTTLIVRQSCAPPPLWSKPPGLPGRHS